MSLEKNNVLKEIIKKVNDEWTEEDSQNRDNLFKKYGELFQLENIDSLTKQKFKQFWADAVFHWGGGGRQNAGNITKGELWEISKKNLKIIVDESKTLSDRIKQLRNTSNQGNFIQSGTYSIILHMVNPQKHPTINDLTLHVLDELKLSSKKERQTDEFIWVPKLENVILKLCDENNIDTWKIDWVWQEISKEFTTKKHLDKLSEIISKFRKNRESIAAGWTLGENSDNEKTRKEFVTKYSLDNIKKLTLENYVEGKINSSGEKTRNNFCSELSDLEPYGRLGGPDGQYAWGIYIEKESQKYHIALDTNLRKQIFAKKSNEEVYSIIQENIIEIIQYGQVSNFDKLSEKTIMDNRFKTKILAVYFPNEHLMIHAKTELEKIAVPFGLFTKKEIKKKTSIEIQQSLLKFKESKENLKDLNNLEYSHILWYYSHGDEKDVKVIELQKDTVTQTRFQSFIDENKEKQIRKYKKVLDQSKGQIIFYGPTGTGKTYIAKQLANHITKVDLDGWKASTHRKIVQFHPSYSYEDFVQGIKPVKDNKGGINYILQPGIFQKFCALTFLNEDSEIKSPKTLPQCCSFVLLKELEHGGNGLSAGEIFDRVKNGHEKHDYGQLFEFSGKEKWQEGVLRHRLFDFKDTIFVHPDKNIWQINPKHEDFEKLQSKFTNEGKISLDKSPKVLIIDEINRGNLSKIFGELIYALEYRGEEIDLQYKEFSEANDYGTLTIPPKDQLMIVGTMNTADRSIILFDAALRRRFSFIPLSPDYDLLAQSLDIDKKFDETKFQTRLNELKGEDKNGKNKILSILALHKINLKLSENLSVGKEKQIGHTFLLEMQSHPENFTKVWAQDILPLLEEYYFESPETIEEWFTPDVYSKQKGIMDFDDETLEKSLKALSDSSSSE